MVDESAADNSSFVLDAVAERRRARRLPAVACRLGDFQLRAYISVLGCTRISPWHFLRQVFGSSALMVIQTVRRTRPINPIRVSTSTCKSGYLHNEWSVHSPRQQCYSPLRELPRAFSSRKAR